MSKNTTLIIVAAIILLAVAINSGYKFTGGLIDVGNWQYQENANQVSTSYDSSSYIGYLYVNYTKPTNAIYALWQIKHSTASTYNITIPSACFNQNSLILRVTSESASTTQSSAECFDGTSWVILSTKSASVAGGGNPGSYQNLMTDGNWNSGASGWNNLGWYDASQFYGGQSIYEEAIWWNIGQVAVSVNGVCGSTNNVCTSGTSTDIADTNNNYLWNCVGSNGGTTASCSVVKCTDINWSNPESGVCVGASAQQTSNCGNTRFTPGTLTCGSGQTCVADHCVNNACVPTGIYTPALSTFCGSKSVVNSCGNSSTQTGTLSCSSGQTCTNNACVTPSCTDSSWTPDPALTCSGMNVTQTSNCGNSRIILGTKNCAVNVQVPTGLTIGTATSTSIQLSWNAISGMSYNIYRSTSPNGPWVKING